MWAALGWNSKDSANEIPSDCGWRAASLAATVVGVKTVPLCRLAPTFSPVSDPGLACVHNSPGLKLYHISGSQVVLTCQSFLRSVPSSRPMLARA